MTSSSARFVLLACLVGCGAPQASQPPPSPPRAAVRLADASKGAPPRLHVRLRSAEDGLHVEIHASGAAFARWTLGADVPAAVEARDDAGRPLRARAEGRRLEIDPAGSVVLSYVLPLTPSALRTTGDAVTTLVEVARFRVLGARALAVPEVRDALVTDIAVEPSDVPVVAASASPSGSRRPSEMTLRPQEIGRLVVLGGPGGHAFFEAPEGTDTCTWLGWSAFDPRAVCAETAGFRTVLHEYFRGREPVPATVSLLLDARPKGRFRAARVLGGVAVATSGNEPWNAEIRLAVAHELVHAWIGERLWVGDATPGREAESAWFQEGVARWVAREQLVHAGLLSPAELAAEVNRLLAIVSTSPLASRPLRELTEAAARRERGALPLVVARGALFATAMDDALRAATKGSFDDVVQTLMELAYGQPGPVPRDVFDTMLAKALGSERVARDGFTRWVDRGDARSLPSSALGGCFEASETSYETRDLGFDLEATRAGEGPIVALTPGGPAASAGVRATDTLVGTEGDGAEVTLRLVRDGAEVAVRIRPVRTRARGQAFRPRPGLTEDACRKLLLRT